VPPQVQFDKYARDARAWLGFAICHDSAAQLVFGNENPNLWFSAAILGHHALEMYLKAALISEGFVIFDPAKVKELDPALGIQKHDCAWAHKLIVLARQLAEKRPEFDLAAPANFPCYWFHEVPQTLEGGFGIFDSFFFELRYPTELRDLKGVGQHERELLNELVESLQPFLKRIT
jgi:hypothetical protein